ncbi:helix-turn-helix domain-containing protein [Flavobacteriaceae bacterium F08102]|nr:helix-turn-helix domain-containing protein [Flavobacteriaceae bacterium F08102]
MVNQEKFSERLSLILTHYGLTASAFAEKLQVQPSSISHLLSGRNKPSLDLVLKMLEEFKEIDLQWLINGKGTFPKSNSQAQRIRSTKTEEKEIERIVIFYSDGTFSSHDPA